MRGSKQRRLDRGGAWELRVDVGRDPVTGKRRQRSRLFRGSSREADRELAKMVAEMAEPTASTRATLSQLVHRWYDQTKDGLSSSTRQGYEWRIRLIDQALGETELAKLTAEHLDRFYLGLARSGGVRRQGHAPATIEQTHAIIRRSLNFGVRWGWVPRNVAEWATPPVVHRDEIESPNVETVWRILRAAEVHPDPNFGPFVRLAAATGARRGELCALRWRHISWEHRTATFAASIVDIRGGAWEEKPTKTRRRRLVLLDPGTVEVLRGQYERQDAFCTAAGVALAQDSFVFAPDPTNDSPWLPDRVTGLFRRLPEAKGVRLHDLRHFHASVLLDRGESAGVVSARVGHTQTSTTQNIYGHRMEGADARAALIIGQVLDESY